jgi:hypothetical protein
MRKIFILAALAACTASLPGSANAQRISVGIGLPGVSFYSGYGSPGVYRYPAYGGYVAPYPAYPYPHYVAPGYVVPAPVVPPPVYGGIYTNFGHRPYYRPYYRPYGPAYGPYRYRGWR